MSVQLTVLMDNASRSPELDSEHGMSMALTLADGSIWLWDTGQSSGFLDNAHAMDIRPETACGIALSHGHYDHTGGLDALLDAGFLGSIHAHEAFARPRFSISQGAPVRDIALRTCCLSRVLEHHVPIADSTPLAEGLTMVTDIVRQPGRFEPVRGFYRDRAGRIPDPVPDDACLLLETSSGPVLILGCCHSGFANTWAHIQKTRGLSGLHAIIGGLHLMHAPDWAREETATALATTGAELIFPCHCTGTEAEAFLRSRLGKRVRPAGAGLNLSF